MCDNFLGFTSIQKKSVKFCVQSSSVQAKNVKCLTKHWFKGIQPKSLNFCKMVDMCEKILVFTSIH